MMGRLLWVRPRPRNQAVSVTTLDQQRRCASRFASTISTSRRHCSSRRVAFSLLFHLQLSFRLLTIAPQRLESRLVHLIDTRFGMIVLHLLLISFGLVHFCGTSRVGTSRQTVRKRRARAFVRSLSRSPEPCPRPRPIRRSGALSTPYSPVEDAGPKYSSTLLVHMVTTSSAFPPTKFARVVPAGSVFKIESNVSEPRHLA